MKRKEKVAFTKEQILFLVEQKGIVEQEEIFQIINEKITICETSFRRILYLLEEQEKIKRSVSLFDARKCIIQLV